jgi:O-antigen ligase
MPKYLVAAVIIFMLDIFLGGVMSDNYAKGLSELKKYWNVFLCAMLFTCPMSSTNRRLVIIVFFAAACLAGLMGILQHYGIIFEIKPRSMGFTHPIHYAGILAFACSTSLMMLLIKNNIFSSLNARAFLVLTASFSFVGILLSQTRGVWVALIVSCLIVLFIYNYKKAIGYLAVMIVLSASVFTASDSLRERAHSIITSARYFYSEDDSLKIPQRYHIWKGALVIFKDSPVLGTGTGDFRGDIIDLMEEGKLNKEYIPSHAHSIYFQWLATQGIVGLLSLVALLTLLIIWGLGEIRKRGGIGGYIIVLAVLLTISGGLTENNIGISKYFAAWCFTMGLIGGHGSVGETV